MTVIAVIAFFGFGFVIYLLAAIKDRLDTQNRYLKALVMQIPPSNHEVVNRSRLRSVPR